MAWKKVYSHDQEGLVLFGTKSGLLEAITNGLNIRLTIIDDKNYDSLDKMTYLSTNTIFVRNNEIFAMVGYPSVRWLDPTVNEISFFGPEHLIIAASNGNMVSRLLYLDKVEVRDDKWKSGINWYAEH